MINHGVYAVLSDAVFMPVAGGDTDELEEELKTLLEESAPDGQLNLPEVPSGPMPTSRKTGVLDDDFFLSLPTVPDTHLNITDEELDRELSRLNISGAGLSVSELWGWLFLPCY